MLLGQPGAPAASARGLGVGSQLGAWPSDERDTHRSDRGQRSWVSQRRSKGLQVENTNYTRQNMSPRGEKATLVLRMHVTDRKDDKIHSHHPPGLLGGGQQGDGQAPPTVSA